MSLLDLLRKKETRPGLTEKEQRWNRFIDTVCTKDPKDLSGAGRMAALCFWYDAEVCNGGHSLYFDCYGDIAPQELMDAITEVAYREIAENFGRAVADGGKDDWRETDRAYETFEPSLMDCLQEYVEKNQEAVFAAYGEPHIEALYAEALLWLVGFQPDQRYQTLLHELFLTQPNCELLLELEELSGDVRDSIGCLERYWEFKSIDRNYETFGRRLFSGLEDAWQTGRFTVEAFGKLCYSLWQMLPEEIDQTEPFWTLLYGDDCLSWGDEEQTKRLYEKAFSFYN